MQEAANCVRLPALRSGVGHGEPKKTVAQIKNGERAAITLAPITDFLSRPTYIHLVAVFNILLAIIDYKRQERIRIS